jgi:hypothetical protein
MELLTRGRDDVLVTLDGVGRGDDDPPLNRLTDGTRSFQGRMSCMLALARIDTGIYNVPVVSPPLEPGELAKLSVVVFHGRTGDRTEALVDATYDADGSLTVTTLPTGRTLKEIVKPGVVIYDPKKVHAANLVTANLATGAQHERFSQITMASVESTPDPVTGNYRVYVTFSGPAPMPGQVQILVDSVGLAEQTVVLEGPGAYGR